MTILRETYPAASRNMMHAYLRIARGLPEAKVEERSGFLCCTGPSEHPICNFAIQLSLDPWSAGELRSLAMERENFLVYSIPGDRPGHLAELLTRAGFVVSQVLVQMTADSLPGDVTMLPLVEAAGDDARGAVASFMSQQFFPRQTTIFRDTMTIANSNARETRLYAMHDQGSTIGALMLCEDDDSLGVYNLCVQPSKRGRGIGTQLVRWSLEQGSRLNKPVTLQCDRHLQPWYTELGFRELGLVSIYRLPKLPHSDIMSFI